MKWLTFVVFLILTGCEGKESGNLIQLSSSGQIAPLTSTPDRTIILPTPTPRLDYWQRALFSPNKIILKPEETILLSESQGQIEIGSPPLLHIENRSRETEIHAVPSAITAVIKELDLKGNPPILELVDDDLTSGFDKAHGCITYAKVRYDFFYQRGYITISVRNIIRGEIDESLKNPLAKNPDGTLYDDYLLGAMSLKLSQAVFHELYHISRDDYFHFVNPKDGDQYEEDNYKLTSAYGQRIEYGEIPTMFYISRTQCFVEDSH